MLAKASKTVGVHNKKLLYSRLIHSHIVYSAPIWGNAQKCHLDKLLKQQKKAIRHITIYGIEITQMITSSKVTYLSPRTDGLHYTLLHTVRFTRLLPKTHQTSLVYKRQ